MFTRQYPKQSSTNDVTFFRDGIRLSHSFVKREVLGDQKYVWIYVDAKKRIGFKFHHNRKPQSLKLTPSGDNTSGKTISCTFLKKDHKWIKEIMEHKNVNKRRFPIKRTPASDVSTEGDRIDFVIAFNFTRYEK